MCDNHVKLTRHLRGLVDEIDPNPTREGVAETPERAAKAWAFWTSGYEVQPADLLKTFVDGAGGCDEMVSVSGIQFYSKCEHHLADIIGVATVAYIPNGRIVGLSKFVRVVDAYARRLQVQERMTNQIADLVATELKAVGVGVHIAARHMCMESRGVQRPGTITHTTALRGAIKSEASARAEFMRLVERDIRL